MPAPLAPVKVTVNPTAEVKPTAPKPKPDAPDFDDALKQARGKPLEQAGEAHPQRTSDAEQPLPLPADEGPSPVDTEESAVETPQVEPSPVATVAGEVLVALEVQQVAAVVAEPVDQVEEDYVDLKAPAVRVAGPTDVAARQPTETDEAASTNSPPVPIVVAAEVPDDDDTEPVAVPKVNDAFGEAGSIELDEPERSVAHVVEASVAKQHTRQQQPQDDQPAAPPVVESADKPALMAEDREASLPPTPVEAPIVEESGDTSGDTSRLLSTSSKSTTVRADVTVPTAVEATPSSQPTSEPAPAPAQASPPTAREVEFARANYDRIVTDIRAQLLPRGGAMQIRLDPPQLGALQVAVQMLDGVMSVSFQTSNEEATQLLSHSLTQLKHVLESQGVSVDKLHVQQAPRSEQSANNSNDSEHQRDQRHGAHEENLARHEQQRKEMLRRMWRRLALGNDPLDLVA